ncbi:MAG: HAD family hydrolase [Thermoanaerobaculia bacterium]
MDDIQAFILDFDETMIDLEPQHATADTALCRAMGSDYATLPEEYRTASGRRVIDDIREMREYFGWDESLEDLERRRRRLFDDACASSELALLPGVERVVRELHATGLPLAITSSAVRSSIEAILERLALREPFALIVDGSEVARPKPDPEPYRLTARRLGVEPQHCLVFEDSAIGVAAAKAAGMSCIAVRNPKAKRRQDLDAADRVVDSFDEIDVASLVTPRRASSPAPAR